MFIFVSWAEFPAHIDLETTYMCVHQVWKWRTASFLYFPEAFWEKYRMYLTEAHQTGAERGATPQNFKKSTLKMPIARWYRGKEFNRCLWMTLDYKTHNNFDSERLTLNHSRLLNTENTLSHGCLCSFYHVYLSQYVIFCLHCHVILCLHYEILAQ